MAARLALIPVLILLIAVPAMAQAGTQVPEASSMTLFAMGAAGVIIGRRLAARRGHRDD